jgi:hypothetical protein
MSFAEIEDILGQPLPASAREHQRWWSNEDPTMTRHSQARAWKTAGYDAEASLAERIVIFRRENPN